MKRLIMFSVLIASLVRGAWAMDVRAIDAYFPLFKAFIGNDGSLLEQQVAAEEMRVAKQYKVVSLNAGDIKQYSNYDEAPTGSVAIINFTNPITKYDFWYEGTQTKMAQLKQADAHPNISAILLNIDSPGGSVDGTKEIADLIDKGLNKPTLSYYDGLGASAAFWIGSSANESYASSKTTEVGSIGTMVSFMDFKGMCDKAGIKEHVIYASKSTDKNKDYHEAIKGNYKPIIEGILDPLNEIFIASVKGNRPQITDKQCTGKIYLAEAAQANGLIDGIMTFEQAVMRAAELGNEFKVTIA